MGSQCIIEWPLHDIDVSWEVLTVLLFAAYLISGDDEDDDDEDEDEDDDDEGPKKGKKGEGRKGDMGKAGEQQECKQQ